MKKFFTTITLLSMFLVVGCVDLDELWNEIDFLKKQNAEKAKELEEENAKFAAFEELYKSVEKLTNSANSEITSLKGLIDALSNRLSVVSYKELEDKSGYELTMSDGSKITLKHGAKGAAGKDGKDGAEGEAGIDGITPEISVKLHTDGLLYWTLNGEFLLDANGNMIPAQGKDGKAGKDGKDGADGAQGTPGKDGKDGKDGATGATGAAGKDAITPLLRINSDLYWEMSLDGGLKWQLVTDANKRPIKAQGPQGAAGPAGQGPAGPKGPTGDQGLPGEKGEPGKDGDANLTITETETTITIIYNGVTFTIPKGEMPPLKMTLTTTKTVGQTISLYIVANEADKADIWIDLNNNGTKDPGESDIVFDNFKDYTLGAQTVTIYGKVANLSCAENSLTTLDVSHNTALHQLACASNLLSTLDVTKNTALMVLDCEINSLTELDVSHNTALTSLSCNENSLTELDVSHNTALLLLLCNENSLTELDLTKNTALKQLYCHSNSLTALDVTNNTELDFIACHANQIEGEQMETLVNSLFDRKNITEGYFRVHSITTPTNVITQAQVAKAKAKHWRVIDDQNHDYDGIQPPPAVSSMTLTTTKNVGETISLFIDAAEADKADVWIDLNNNGTKDPDESDILFEGNKDYTLGAQTITIYGNVTCLSCGSNSLTSLDVTKNTALTYLGCRGNSLITLDVTKNIALQQLDCYQNSLTTLDVTKNIALIELLCFENLLTSLDVTKNTLLSTLNCSSNSLTSLDLSQNTVLQTLFCYENQIKKAAMDYLVNSIVDRSGMAQGMYDIEGTSGVGNEFDASHLSALNLKNWFCF